MACFQFDHQGAKNDLKITYVKVTDLLFDRNSKAEILEGGPGFTFVKMRFLGSGRNGYSFVWEVYAE